jgi:hypothetical protein
MPGAAVLYIGVIDDTHIGTILFMTRHKDIGVWFLAELKQKRMQTVTDFFHKHVVFLT